MVMSFSAILSSSKPKKSTGKQGLILHRPLSDEILRSGGGLKSSLYRSKLNQPFFSRSFFCLKMGRISLLSSLKLLMILIWICWISLWLLKPTQLWTKGWHKAEDKARASLFGYYGLNFAVYSFPVIAVAIMGLIYLNFRPWKKGWSRQKKPSISTLSNPLLINSFLGILTGVEILVLSLFVAFLVWTFYVRISNDLHKIIPIKSMKLKNWELVYLRVATRAGLLAEACLALLLFPILRGLSLFQLLGIQFEASVKYHIWLGTAMLVFATFHGASTLFIWGVSHYIKEEISKWQKTGRIYLAGEMALITGLVIWITALPQVRRRKFELFYYTHHLYIVFLVFFLFHAGDRHFYNVFPGVFLFAIDRLLRFIHTRPGTCLISASVLPCKCIQLILPKDTRLKYVPTSVVFVKIPMLSKFQWHAFSVTSSSNVDDYTISLVIKSEGSWTNSLYNLLKTEMDSDSDSDSDQLKCIPVSIEGPYGPTSTDFLRYDSLLLIAGGIGITPFLSILQEISSTRNRNRHGFPSRIQLVHAVKKSQDICLLNSISSLLLNQSNERLNIKLKVFVTKEEQSNALTLRELLCEYSQMKTINFSTKGSNFAVEGLGNLLWIAVIVGLSSITFLVFLVCFNHVVVPPGKTTKQMKDKIPSWVSDLLLLSSFVIAMLLGSMVAIFLRWRKLKREKIPMIFENQDKDKESSSLSARGADIEEHEIYFGARPNFQDLFSKFADDTGGNDQVGVLVCGPESMKESVAALCKRKYHQGFKVDKKSHFSFHSLNFTL